MAVCGEFDGDRRLISESLDRAFAAEGAEVSVSECRARLKVLRGVLMDLPRHALRLLRRIEKQIRRAIGADQPSPGWAEALPASLCHWRLPGNRIERPPDHRLPALPST